MKCERCHKEVRAYTTSMFNTEMICIPCKEKEKEHPLYEKAREAEYNAVKSGNYNFPGIGKPFDL